MSEATPTAPRDARRRRVVVAGNLSLDDTVTPTASFPAAAGGDALYASLGVRIWGAQPILLTLVGDDYPAAHLARIREAGIDVAHVRPVDGPTIHYRVTYSADGSRTFAWVSAEERLAATSPMASDYALLPPAAWFHFAAMPIEAHEIGVAAAREADIPFSIDPHEEFVVGHEDRLRALVAGSVFLPSELEARLLFPDLDGEPSVAFAHAAAARLDAWDPSVVAIKLGGLGSVVRWEGRTVHVPALPAPVVDPTGAGDAYCGGFIAATVAGASPVVAAACGAIAAAEIIGAVGAFTTGPVRSASDRARSLIALLRRIPLVDRGGQTPQSLARVVASWAAGAASDPTPA